jgi:hypothetical protein
MLSIENDVTKLNVMANKFTVTILGPLKAENLAKKIKNLQKGQG